MIEYRYRLIYDGVITELGYDPKDFQGLTSKLERDFNKHGVFFFFTEGDLKLSFPGEGREILKRARDIDGFNADVILDIDSRPDEYSPWEDEFQGSAIMENLVITQDYAEVDFEEVTFLRKINNRIQDSIDIEGTLDLDGNAITGLTPQTLVFPGFLSLTKLLYDRNFGEWQSGTGMTYSNIENSFSFALINNEIEYSGNVKAYKPSASNVTAPTLEIGNRIEAPNQEEEYSIDVKLGGNLNWSGSGTPSLTFTFRLYEVDIEAATETLVDSQGVSVTTTSGTQSISLSYSRTINEIPYEYFIETDVSGSGGGGTAITFIGNEISFTGESEYPSRTSECSFFNFFDSLDKSLEIVTGQANMLESTILDNGGDLETLGETNGYNLRVSESPYKVSLKDRLDSVLNLFGLGYGLEVDYNNELNKFRVEQIAYFYQNVQLVQFNEIETSSYREEFYEGLLFNNITFESKKYADDEEGTALESIKDYNTKVSYSIESVNLEGEYNKETPAITSNILIEDTRKQQFINPDIKSWKYDADLFLIDVVQDYTGDLVPRLDDDLLTDNVTTKYPYNLLYNPRFAFFNHSELINSMLYVLNNDTRYINTGYAINNESKIGYSDSFSSPGLGDTRQFNNIADVPQSDENFSGVAYNQGLRLFDPIKITFRTAITATQVNLIIDNHRNAGSENYGFISVINPDGELVSGWLLSMSYNIVDKIGTFELVKLGDNYFS